MRDHDHRAAAGEDVMHILDRTCVDKAARRRVPSHVAMARSYIQRRMLSRSEAAIQWLSRQTAQVAVLPGTESQVLRHTHPSLGLQRLSRRPRQVCWATSFPPCAALRRPTCKTSVELPSTLRSCPLCKVERHSWWYGSWTSSFELG